MKWPRKKMKIAYSQRSVCCQGGQVQSRGPGRVQSLGLLLPPGQVQALPEGVARGRAPPTASLTVGAQQRSVPASQYPVLPPEAAAVGCCPRLPGVCSGSRCRPAGRAARKGQ